MLFCEKKERLRIRKYLLSLKEQAKSEFFSLDDDECSINLALPKMKFAEYVNQHPNEFFFFATFIEFF